MCLQCPTHWICFLRMVNVGFRTQFKIPVHLKQMHTVEEICSFWLRAQQILFLASEVMCCVSELDHTFCSAALLRLLEVSSRIAANAPNPRPRERTRNIPLRLCGCMAEDRALSAMQLLAHHLLRR